MFVESSFYPYATLGFRVWRWSRRENCLTGIHWHAKSEVNGNKLDILIKGDSGSYKPRWHEGVNDAVCFKRDHPAPSQDCFCGFNCFSTPDGLLNPVDRYYDYYPAVFGFIAGWGDCIYGDKGAAFSKAVILGFFQPRWRDKNMKELTDYCNENNIPICDRETFDYKEYAREKDLMLIEDVIY